MKWWLFLLVFLSVATQAQTIDTNEQFKKLKDVTDTSRINTLIILGNYYTNRDADKADSLIQLALAESKSYPYTDGEIRALNILTQLAVFRGDLNTGKELNTRALELALKEGNDRTISQTYGQQHRLYFSTGEYAKAREAAINSLEHAEAVHARILIADANSNLAIINGINGKYTEAVDYFLKAMKVYEELDRQTNVCGILLNIGHTLEMAGSHQQALDYLHRSLTISQREDHQYYVGWSLVNIGVIQDKLFRPDSAIHYFEESLRVSEENNFYRLRLTALDNLGGQYSLRREFDKANDYLNRAFRLSEQSGQNSRLVYITGNLAENYLYMEKFDSARIFAQKQLELALANDLISEQQVAYYTLAQTYDSLGDLKEANRSLWAYLTIRDSVFSKEKSEQIEALRETYEADQREKAITSLESQKNAEQFRRNTFAGTAGVILLLGVLVYRNQRLKVRKNKALFLKEQEVDLMKSRFYDNITHEFRTPLTLILGPIGIIREKEMDPQLRQHLKVMERNASILLDLVNQMLELTRLESGTVSLNAYCQNIVPVVKGIVMSFESLAGMKHIDLKVNAIQENISLYFDQNKLEKILINLISNALKFTPENGRIELDLSADTHHFHLSVCDNGTGIPEEELESVFDRFYQSGSDHIQYKTGTGIGLALVRELVGLHHGTIKAEPAYPRGSKFIIELPLGSSHLTPEQIMKEPGKERISIPPVHTDAKPVGIPDSHEQEMPLLLIVEDNEDVLNFIIETLKNDYSILTAPDGRVGVGKAMEAVPDLVISDVMMPEMDGYALCKKLKNEDCTSHIPVILLTAKSVLEDRLEGYDSLADDYITKPFAPQELRVRTANLIASRRHLREKFGKELILQPKNIKLQSSEEQFIRRILDIMEEEIGNDQLSVEYMAEKVHMSRSQLHRKMVALTGRAPTQFIRSFRLARAREMIMNHSATVSEISYQVGFGSPSYFTKCFREEYGHVPGEFINSNTPPTE